MPFPTGKPCRVGSPAGAETKGMEAHVRRLDTVIVLELAGRVDEFHSGIVRDELDTIVSTGRMRIAIDLRGVTALSARCVLAWLDVHEKTLLLGGGVVLVGPRGAPRELVEATGLASVMPVVGGLEDLARLPFGGGGGLDFEARAKERPSFGRRLARWLKGTAAVLAAFGAASGGFAPGACEASPLSLDQAIALAKERSPLVRLARSRFEEKDASFEIARKSPLPRFTGTLGYLHQSNPNGLSTVLNREANALRSGTSDTDAAEVQTRNETRIDRNSAVVGIGALQILYAGGFFVARQDLATRERELGEIDVRLAELEISVAVRDLFLGIVLLEEKARLLHRKAQAIAAKRAAIQAAVASRALGESAATEAEIEELRLRRETSEARGDLEGLRAQFNALLGRPEGVAVEVRLPDGGAIESAPSKEPFAAAIARHPTLAKGLKQIAAAESYMKLVRSQEMFVPKAFAFGGVDHTRGIGVNARLFNWSVGVGLVVPLFDGGVQAEETRKALALRSQAETGYEIEEAKVEEQAREGERKLALAREGLTLALRARDLAARAVAQADEAASSSQIPRFRAEEARVRGVEAELAVLAARAEVVRWHSVIATLAGRTGEMAP